MTTLARLRPGQVLEAAGYIRVTTCLQGATSASVRQPRRRKGQDAGDAGGE